MVFKTLVESILKYRRETDNFFALSAMNALKRELTNDLTQAFILSQPLVDKNPNLFFQSKSFLDFLLKVCDIPFPPNDPMQDESEQSLRTLNKEKTTYWNQLQKARESLETCEEEKGGLARQLEEAKCQMQKCRDELEECHRQLNNFKSQAQLVLQQKDLETQLAIQQKDLETRSVIQETHCKAMSLIEQKDSEVQRLSEELQNNQPAIASCSPLSGVFSSTPSIVCIEHDTEASIDLKTQLENQHKQWRECQDNLKNAEYRRKECFKQLEETELKLKSAEDNLEVSRNNIQNFKTRLEEKTKQVTDLKNQLDEKESEHTKLFMKQNQNEKHMENLQGTLTNLELQLQQETDKKNNCLDENHNLRNRISSQETQLNQLETQQNLCQKELDRREKEMAQQLQDLETQREKVKQLQCMMETPMHDDSILDEIGKEHPNFKQSASGRNLIRLYNENKNHVKTIKDQIQEINTALFTQITFPEFASDLIASYKKAPQHKEYLDKIAIDAQLLTIDDDFPIQVGKKLKHLKKLEESLKQAGLLGENIHKTIKNIELLNESDMDKEESDIEFQSSLATQVNLETPVVSGAPSVDTQKMNDLLYKAKSHMFRRRNPLYKNVKYHPSKTKKQSSDISLNFKRSLIRYFNITETQKLVDPKDLTYKDIIKHIDNHLKEFNEENGLQLQHPPQDHTFKQHFNDYLAPWVLEIKKWNKYYVFWCTTLGIQNVAKESFQYTLLELKNDYEKQILEWEQLYDGWKKQLRFEHNLDKIKFSEELASFLMNQKTATKRRMEDPAQEDTKKRNFEASGYDKFSDDIILYDDINTKRSRLDAHWSEIYIENLFAALYKYLFQIKWEYMMQNIPKNEDLQQHINNKLKILDKIIAKDQPNLLTKILQEYVKHDLKISEPIDHGVFKDIVSPENLLEKTMANTHNYLDKLFARYRRKVHSPAFNPDSGDEME